MKRALLVGSSFSAAPIFFLLKKRGLHVSVCGGFKDDPCHQYADASFYVDYSNPEALLDLVLAEKFDYIVPSCNDYSYMSCAWFAERLGYAGFDNFNTATILHTKNEFRRATRQYGIPAPHTYVLPTNDVADCGNLRYPLLVKPVDAFSGRGVCKVTDAAHLYAAVAAAREASGSGEVVLEAFIDGSLHSHSAFIRNRAIVSDFFVDEFCTVYPYQVDCSNHPSRLSATIRNAVRASMTQLVTHLNLTDGLLHTQFITDGERHSVIECMRRAPGDLYGSMIERSTGVPYTDYFVRPFIGETVPASGPTHAHTPERCKPIGRHTVSVQNPLSTYTFAHTIPVPHVHIAPLKSSGERLQPAPFGKLAILFAEFTDEAELFAVTPTLADHIRIESLEGVYLHA